VLFHTKVFAIMGDTLRLTAGPRSPNPRSQQVSHESSCAEGEHECRPEQGMIVHEFAGMLSATWLLPQKVSRRCYGRPAAGSAASGYGAKAAD
jgi:hypothetical protein